MYQCVVYFYFTLSLSTYFFNENPGPFFFFCLALDGSSLKKMKEKIKKRNIFFESGGVLWECLEAR